METALIAAQYFNVSKVWRLVSVMDGITSESLITRNMNTTRKLKMVT